MSNNELVVSKAVPDEWKMDEDTGDKSTYML